MSDTEVTADEVGPVDLGTIARVLSDENLEYRLEEGTLRTGFVNAAIVFALDGDALVFEAMWRGQFPKDMATQVLYACNEHNQSTFAPTLRFLEAEEGILMVSAMRILDIAHGASLNQLGAFTLSSIDATLRAFDYLESTFPTLVTWEDKHHEH